ncbi:MAG: hypothetical protein SGCHY_002039 [Lobulomycetales sp.]
MHYIHSLKKLFAFIKEAGQEYNDLGLMLRTILMDLDWLRACMTDSETRDRWTELIQGIESAGYRELRKIVLDQ